MKARNYEPMLKLAEEIVDFRGFQSEVDKSNIAGLERKFRKAQIAFAYREIRRSPDPTSLRANLIGDLQRHRSTDEHSPEAIAYVRDQLIAEIPRLTDRHPVQLFAKRWGPAMILVGASSVKFYFLFLR